MCGINGYFQYKPNLSNYEIQQLIKTMDNDIIHRGPDDEGVFTQGNVGIGMRRLSIIDLSTGKQPIFNENRTLGIVFNGEIYNFKELKQELLEKGHVFSTKSDTEIIIHSFEEYGTKSFNKLKGMFAFAIYDLVQNKMFIVRDRAGEKPLYYYNNSEFLLFGSEVKSLISTGMIKKKICRKALNQYLQLTYIPAPLSIFEGVNKLLPGHYIEVDANGNMKMEKYWDVKYVEKDLINDYHQCKQKLRSTLFNAVEECMISDVPFGAFLSGGIDSTIITGIMSKISNKPIDTFTIGFKEKQYDESKRAQMAATFHKTNHHVFFLDYQNVLPELDKLINNIDEPFADTSLIPTFMVSNYASKHVKTVLTGDSGDELFGGYAKYLIGYYAGKYKKIPKWFRNNIIKKTVHSLPDHSTIMRKIKKVVDNSDQDLFQQRRNLMCLGFNNEELHHLLKDDSIEANSLEFIHDFYVSQTEIDDELSCALYTDFKVVLEGCMLPKVDRASMFCSLETRVPILHKDVIELAAQIPSEYKINSKKTKIILKETFIDLIPIELLNASKKGFGIPIENWFKKELKDELLSLLSREFIEEQALFNYDFIKLIIDEHLSTKKNRGRELWTLFVFQRWYNNYYSTFST